jgi:hypothetical protein
MQMRSSLWLERLTANAPVATVLGLIPASVGTVESEGRQMKQCWIQYVKKIKNPPKNIFKKKIILGLNKSIYLFLSFERAPLISCRLCQYPSGSGENLWEKFFVLKFAAKLLSSPPCYWLNYWFLLVHCSSSYTVFLLCQSLFEDRRKA